MSTIASHLPLRPLEIEAWFQKTQRGNDLWGIELSHDQERSSRDPIHIESNIATGDASLFSNNRYNY